MDDGSVYLFSHIEATALFAKKEPPTSDVKVQIFGIKTKMCHRVHKHKDGDASKQSQMSKKEVSDFTEVKIQYSSDDEYEQFATCENEDHEVETSHFNEEIIFPKSAIDDVYHLIDEQVRVQNNILE
tara:strand:+ start:249 stop:629 length:381 start_codon:yes stop_codon:yes gene_type:complete